MERKKFKTAPFKEIDESKPKKRGQYWCPYCNEWRSFKVKNGGYARCTGCGISLEDSHVKDCNHLWGDIHVKPRK